MGLEPSQPDKIEGIDHGLLIENGLLRGSGTPILVAEDNLVNQRIITLLLEKLGLQAHVVSNGRQAVAAVTVREYPVVLMDCHMPEMDGFEATRAIRQMETATGRYTPIIAVTALAMAGDRERCIAAGMDDYIPKPIDKERLKNKLNQWMKQEFVFRNQKLAERFFEANAASAAFQMDPIDLAELEVFYGSSEEVEEVLQLFVGTSKRQMPDLETALSEQGTSLAARTAHELKGASASVGAKEMSLLCLQLEQQLGQQDWEAARQTFAKVQECFKSVCNFVERTFAKAGSPVIQS